MEYASKKKKKKAEGEGDEEEYDAEDSSARYRTCSYIFSLFFFGEEAGFLLLCGE